LKEIHIPSGVLEICTGAFDGAGIEEVIWDGSPTLQTFATKSFGNTPNLKSIEIPVSCTEICPNAFEGSGI
jgi:hypothetical protein